MLAVGLAALLLGLLRSPQGTFLPSSESTPEPRQQWAVEVTGSVRTPGIYTFKDPPTRRQVIDEAGGLLRNPSISFVGSEENLPSGTRLDVKERSSTSFEAPLYPMGARVKLVLGIPIDVNGAETEDLVLVPGISEGLARRIVDNRESEGAFTTWHDLRRVKGVGPMKMKAFQNYLCINVSP
jgi:competence protein ComEA